MPKQKTESKIKMVRRQVLLPDELYDLCVDMGAASDVSASAIIRYALRDYMVRRGKLEKAS